MRTGVVACGTVAVATLIFMGAAAAADLGVKAPVYKAPPVASTYNWSGCHLGAEGGGIWGNSRHIQDDAAAPATNGLALTDRFNLSGAVIGGTVGCDYQFSTWVIGIENDLSWTNDKGGTNIIPPFSPATNRFETSENWIDTLRARFGFARDRWLVYGTAGVAFTQEGIRLCALLAAACGTASQDVIGWTVGAGVEYAFWNNWSAKLEYLYVDFSKTAFGAIPTVSTAGVTGTYLGRDVSLTNQIFRAGINYKFDWMPSAVVARY